MTRSYQVWLSAALIAASLVPDWFDPILRAPVVGPTERMFLLLSCLAFATALSLLAFRASAMGRGALVLLVALGVADCFVTGDAVRLQMLLTEGARIVAVALLFMPGVSRRMAAERAAASARRSQSAMGPGVPGFAFPSVRPSAPAAALSRAALR